MHAAGKRPFRSIRDSKSCRKARELNEGGWFESIAGHGIKNRTIEVPIPDSTGRQPTVVIP